MDPHVARRYVWLRPPRPPPPGHHLACFDALSQAAFPLLPNARRANDGQVLEKQWANVVECETSPHEWMLGVAASKIQAAREKLAAYVRAHKQDVALVENCTAATSAVVRAARFQPGDVVLHLSTAYGMVKNCLRHATGIVGAETREVAVEFHGNGTAPCGADGAPLAATLAAALDDVHAHGQRVALVTFDYIASCPGVLMPVHEMARECKARGVPVLLDGAHVLGQIPLDCHALEKSGVTYFMADAHKWLFSPKGSAMLWVTRSAQPDVHPSVVGAVCSNTPYTNFNPAVLEGLSEFERRFQYTGTRDYTPLIAVHHALEWRERVGEAAILGYNRGMAVWAQQWLAAVWRTETLVPADSTAFMAHARVPLRNGAAALLLNRRLKEECVTHLMAFSLPARKHLGETEPTHWIRPCIQLFVHPEDIRDLGANVLRMAPGCEAAAKAGAQWLAKSRRRINERLAAEAALNSLPGAHKVTVGFDVAPVAAAPSVEAVSAFGRRDSARDFTQLMPHKESEAVAAVAKYSAGQLGSNNSSCSLFSLREDTEMLAEVANSLEEVVTLQRSLGTIGHGINVKKSSFQSESPMSVFDGLGTSVASSMGTSVDGSGFMAAEWMNDRKMHSRSAQYKTPQINEQGC